MFRTLSMVAVFLLAACSNGDPGAASGETDIEAFKIDGVWVFQHNPDSAMDALHSGTPEVVNGCLIIDDTVVVWHTNRLDEATTAVAAAIAGEQPQLLIAGGGLSANEGADPSLLPSIITDRCPTDQVWFGAP